jgi:hypothetical protein
MPQAATKSSTTAHKADPSIAKLEQHKRASQNFFKHAKVADERSGDVVAERDLDRASAAEEHAAWEFATTEPTIIAGSAEFLAYVVNEPVVGFFGAHRRAFR